MRTKQELELFREQARTLRRQGKSLRQIKEILGPMSNVTLHDALRGVPPPDWTLRPNAKDELRAKARELRAQGMDYEEIATALGVAKGSVSHWVRDLPRPERLSYAECRKRSAEGTQRYWEAERGVREARRASERAAAAGEIGDLTDRELLVAGAIAYWCEGAKRKPGRRDDRVVFINSDPCLIRFFLCFLHAAGVERDRLTYRVHIHETADVAIADQFWAEIAEVEVSQFKKPTLKRHNPKTLRKNIGDDYHGCLVIGVLRSAEL